MQSESLSTLGIRFWGNSGAKIGRRIEVFTDAVSASLRMLSSRKPCAQKALKERPNSKVGYRVIPGIFALKMKLLGENPGHCNPVFVGDHRNVMRNNKTVVICSLSMQSVKENLLAAFRYLVKPLVRLAVKNSVSFPDFSEALKKAYVDVAARQIMASKMAVSAERISLITSIPVGEVSDLLRAGDDASFGRAAQAVSPLAIILSAWHTDPKYTGPYGVLRDLEYVRSSTSSDRSADTFTDLVRTYCPEITPQVLLDELIRLEAVQEVGDGYYRAMKRSYVPEPLSVPSILNLARVVHNLCETLEFNLRAASVGGERLIERSIYSVHGIAKNEHSAFDKFIRARGQAFADDVDNWITARDVEGIKDGMQIGVSFYHYIVNEDDESALSKDFQN